LAPLKTVIDIYRMTTKLGVLRSPLPKVYSINTP